MLQVFLCDDNEIDILQYANLILQLAAKNQIQVELSCFSNCETMLVEICEFHRHVDIIYLDIVMDKVNGMEAARYLRDCGSYAQIVFLTASLDYMNQAFDVDAVQYLLKGQVSDSMFEQVFRRAVSRVIRQKEELFICEFNGIRTSVPVRQIAYFEVMNRIMMIHHGKGKAPIKFYASMNQLEMHLEGKDFLRTHRSYLVNLSYVAKFGARVVILKSGIELPIGSSYMTPVKRAFADYISGNHIFMC
ncbi:LytR/AlgR family response regulator transcription factor [Lacrimispora brassicae]